MNEPLECLQYQAMAPWRYKIPVKLHPLLNLDEFLLKALLPLLDFLVDSIARILNT